MCRLRLRRRDDVYADPPRRSLRDRKHDFKLDAMKNQDPQAITAAQGSPVKAWEPPAAPCKGELIARLI